MSELLTLSFAVFLGGTITAAFVTGLSGFAFGMVAAAVWLYALPPPQAFALIAAYAILVKDMPSGSYAICWMRIG